jgi:hypothetical protein
MRTKNERRVPHGSPAGFDEGCRTPASCPNHRSPEVLTCAEAAVRRRGDFMAGRLPVDLPLERATSASVFRQQTPARGPVHGTPWGYARGCRDARQCPNWSQGRRTCVEARRRYFADYTRRRRTGDGTPISHGTVRGYSAGCRGGADCAAASHGKSCAEAWREYKLAHARAAGVKPAEAGIPPGDAAIHVKRWSDAGMSTRRIARLAGIGRTTVRELIKYAEGAGGRRELFLPETVGKVITAAVSSGARDVDHG